MRALVRFAAAALTVVVAVGCAPAGPTAGLSTPGPTLAPTAPATPAPSDPASASPGAFAFDAESILGYYATLGFTCGPEQPSTKAIDYAFRSCALVDANGRTRVVGITTDPNDDVADAFASLTGTAAEKVLDPSVAVEPFAAFLGAVLGETKGESLLDWLAGHLGDDDARTMLGDLTIATYTESPQDHSRLYLEIANQDYLESPTPSSSATAP